MMTMQCAQARPLLPAYGELDVPHALALEAHLAGCPACSEALHAERALGEALRAHAPYHRAPEALRARLRTSLPPAPQGVLQSPVTVAAASARRRQRVLRQWAMPLAAAFVLTIGLNALLAGQREKGLVVDEIVAGHVRSLLAAHLDDVVSSDQHTVKPWFAGKLDYAPPVHDLALKGYPLAGGRLDYVGNRTVAALDYRRRQHIINLYVWPAEKAGRSTPLATTRSGYNLEHWTDDGMNWWAVSDLSADELRSFADLLRATTERPPA